MIPDPGIHLTDAGVTLAGRRILAPLTLSLTEDRIGVLGRNGSGKTTLLRLIAGLIAPDAGRVLVDGVAPTDRRALLPRLGILFQNPDHQILFPTVEEELAFGLLQLGRSKAEAEAMVAAALAAEGRAHWARAPTSALSQGQRHHLCLLAVLMMQPATILLDEPFAGLDLPTSLRLTRRLAALPQRLITVSHDPTSLAAMDRILWLDEGHLQADGPPDRVIPAFLSAMERIGALDADTDIAG